jgi:YfiH family protein
MIPRTQNGIPFFQFHNLAAHTGLWHGIFTRQGGLSPPPYDSLNVTYGLGDSPAVVTANRQALSQCTPSGSIITARQVHGAQVLVLTDAQQQNDTAKDELPQADALVTNVPGVYLMVQVADCQSILIYDPVNRAVANIHSGWRGSLHNICQRTIDIMTSTFGCRTDDLWIGIGPSLGPCCAEFINYQKEFPESFWHYCLKARHFDFWTITQDQLCAAGVDRHKIETSGWCTHCRTDLFFSYRKEGTTGRFATIIGLSPE